MEKYYEMIRTAEDGQVWEFFEENSAAGERVAIAAETAAEAEQVFIDNIDYEHEDAAAAYTAREMLEQDADALRANGFEIWKK